MSKKLNVQTITSDLQSSAFFSSQPDKKPEETVAPSPIPQPETPKPITPISKQDKDNQPIPDRPIARSSFNRGDNKRIITRNAFEIYEDQIIALRKISYNEKLDGKQGSMSQMVREAIDTYLQKRSTDK